MNEKLTKIHEVLDTFLEKLNSEYNDTVSISCDMSGNPHEAMRIASTFLLDTIPNEIILALPKNDTVYNLVHEMFEYEGDVDNIPYQSATFSHKEYLDYISGLHVFKNKILQSLDVNNEIEYAGNLVNVFENDKKFIEALFDPEIIADKTEHDLTMDVETASREFVFLIKFREYLAEMGREIEQVVSTDSESVVERRLEMLYISSITFYAYKQTESVLKTLKDVASAMCHGDATVDNSVEVPYGIF